VIYAPLSSGRVKSRFADLYEQHLQSWANELQAYCNANDSDTVIVAISRKGPRLIELLIHEGFLPQSFKSRVISELALPFVKDYGQRILIVDDSVSHGTTFLKIHQIARQMLPNSELISLPFAIGKEISSNCKSKIDNYFLSLDRTEIAPFVNNEALAFHFLGKPFDLEHPICCIKGSFSNQDELKLLLQQLAEGMNAELIPLETQVPTFNETFTKYSWTLLFNSSDDIPSITEPAFRKVRFSLQPGTNKLYLTAMQPINVALEDDYFNKIKDALPKQLGNLWESIYNSAKCRKEKLHLGFDKELQKQVDDAFTRSFCMWASYLNSFLLLSSVKKVVEETSFQSMPEKEGSFSQSFEDDLRYLVGRDFMSSASKALQNFLIDSPNFDNHTIKSFSWDYDPVNGKEIIMPDLYIKKYEEDLRSFKEKFQEDCDIETALRGILCVQHLIEVDSRKFTSPDGNHNRLDFGVTYKGLEEEVKNLVKRPVISSDFNYYLDKLIDEGCIVPRYINMNMNTQAKPFWARAFRVGESPCEKRKDILYKIFQYLQDNWSTELGPITRKVLEEFCAIAFSLKGFTEISRIPKFVGFGEFDVSYEPTGVRCYFSTDSRHPEAKESIFAWAFRQGVFVIDEQNSEISLNFAPQEDQSGVDGDVVEELEYFVELFVKILKHECTDGITGSSFISYLATINSHSNFSKVAVKRLRIWRNNFGKEIFPVDQNRDCNNLQTLLEHYNEIKRCIDFNHATNSPCTRFITSFSTIGLTNQFSQATSNKNRKLWKVLEDATSRVASGYSNSNGFVESKLNDLLKAMHILTETTIGLINSPSNQLLINLQRFFNDVDDTSKQGKAVHDRLRASGNISFEDIQFILEEWFIVKLDEVNNIEPSMISEKDIFGYFLKWDVIQSTSLNQADLVEFLQSKNSLIVNYLHPDLEKKYAFQDFEAMNDGYGCICASLAQVLEIYCILTVSSQGSLPSGFRFGCAHEKFKKENPSDGYVKACRLMRAIDPESQAYWVPSESIDFSSLPSRDFLVISQEVYGKTPQENMHSLLERYGLRITQPYSSYQPKGFSDSGFTVYVISRNNGSF
jgi:hypothetical protein